MTDNQNNRHYWAIFHKDEIIFTGTFKECWNEFVRQHGDRVVADVVADGYKVARAK